MVSSMLSPQPHCMLQSKGGIPCHKTGETSQDKLCQHAQRWQRNRGDEGFTRTGYVPGLDASACTPELPCQAVMLSLQLPASLSLCCG